MFSEAIKLDAVLLARQFLRECGGDVGVGWPGGP